MDTKNIEILPGSILLFSCVRNERLRLPYFLQYHRALGINRFFIVDNDSNDETNEYLISQDDVYTFFTRDSYAHSKCGVVWLNMLLNKYGVGHWTLTLDADELLVYPECESVKLPEFTTYLEKQGAQGIVTFLLDMYSCFPIKNTILEPDTPFLNICEYFDPDTYHEVDENGVPIRGGARHRLFWERQNREKPSPVLKKIPLVKWRMGLKYEASTHIINGLDIDQVTGCLLHFKFFSDLFDRARDETLRKEHWDGAAQYESYWKVLQKNPALCAIYERSTKYNDSKQLVKLNLLKSSNDYIRYCGELCEK